MDDSKIVELYLKRDETALELTQSEYGRRMLGLASNIVSDSGTAEECVNDAYLKAWNSIPPNRPFGYLAQYLLRITRQIALNRVRHQATEKRSADIVELTQEMEQCIPFEADMTEGLEAKELKAAINGFLSGLSREKRDVFVRRYWFCDSVAEVASLTGFSQSKVKTMLFRMRADLRAYLENKGYTV